MPWTERWTRVRRAGFPSELVKVRHSMSAVLPNERAAVEPTDARALTDAAEAIVSARNLARRYGSGGTPGDALRGGSPDVGGGGPRAGEGPSGARKAAPVPP